MWKGINFDSEHNNYLINDAKLVLSHILSTKKQNTALSDLFDPFSLNNILRDYSRLPIDAVQIRVGHIRRFVHVAP